MRYLLDANALVHVANQVPGSEHIVARIGRTRLGAVQLSAITAYELHSMILNAKASARHLANLRALVREFAGMRAGWGPRSSPMMRRSRACRG